MSYLAAILESEIEREAADALRLGTCRDLQALDDARVALVLKTGVLTLRVFTNNGKVNVVVASGESRERLAEYDRGVDVELLAHRDVPRNVTRLRDGSKENTWKQMRYFTTRNTFKNAYL